MEKTAIYNLLFKNYNCSFFYDLYGSKNSVNRCKSVSDKMQVEKTNPIFDRANRGKHLHYKVLREYI